MRSKVIVFTLVLVFIICAAAGARTTQVSWGSAKEFRHFTLSHVKWDKAAGGFVFDANAKAVDGEDAKIGIIESPEVSAKAPFDELVPSWNAYSPAGSYLTVLVKARVDGTWTKWYKMMLWDENGQPQPKSSFKDQDDMGRVGQDTLHLKKGKGDAFKVRIELQSVDGKAYPTLRFVSMNANDPDKWTEEIAPVKSVWGTELDIPYLCQLSVPGGGVWCSPTSTAMVLDYWSKKLNRPEMNVGIVESAGNCKDNGWGGTGNWSFNVAYAGQFKGMRAFVDRLTSVSQIEWWISKGVPVIVSLDYTRLNRRNSTRITGHLMVIRGFTKDGNPVFNDPWAYLEKGEKLRKEFKRADLEYAWLGPQGSYGTVYIIYPEGYKL